ncbi:MAG: hypothetical protein ACE5KM_17090 [Planctomycetaceae bacterium]
MPASQGTPWLFSARVDLAAFLGSAVVALAALLVGSRLGVLHGDSPEWTWVTAILFIDVAHVYSTAFRVYFDPAEMKRRRWLYVVTPLLAFATGLALYSEGELLFWRVLAYLAVFHFVRQQYGWVALYRAKAGETNGAGKWIDTAAIYLATLYPLVYWHAHLPRRFWWFLRGDFAGLSIVAEQIVEPVYWAALAVYLGRSLYRGVRFGRWNPGKDIVVATTAVCWHVGIITFNSDYAFTVTNVIIHGVPYIVLVYWYRFYRRESAEGGARSRWRGIVVFLATIWLLAYVEELLWCRGIWHEREWLFGSAWEVGRWRGALVALLAVPQITHYVLDGFIWRRRSNPDVAAAVGDR